MNLRDMCQLCTRNDDSLDRALYDMAHIETRDLATLSTLSRHQADGFFQKVRDIANRRGQEKRQALDADHKRLSRMRDDLFDQVLDLLAHKGSAQTLIDGYLDNDARYALEESVAHGDMPYDVVEEKDVLEALNVFRDAGLIDVFADTYRLTPRGCRRLAVYILKKTLETIIPGLPGANLTGDEGFGMSEGFVTRKYESGDEFALIDTQATLLAALERGGPALPIQFVERDIRIRETLVESRMASGLLIDVSGSMEGNKLKTAEDVCLALGELIRRTGNDILRTYIFSNTVEEIPYWQIHNRRLSGTVTDIAAALKRFRTDTRSFHGARQAYLITDMSSNTENGSYVGFERAAPRVLEEARRCSLNGIAVNIVMLDETRHLSDFASILARRSTGRVFFTRPDNLGTIIIEDYLRKRRRKYPA